MRLTDNPGVASTPHGRRTGGPGRERRVGQLAGLGRLVGGAIRFAARRAQPLVIAVATLAACAAPGAARIGSGHDSESSPPASRAATSTEAFYVDPDSPAAVWVRDHPDNPGVAAIRSTIATRAAARWFGDWTNDVGSAVARYIAAASAARQVPIVVAYNLPLRDCGQHSKGGAATTHAYRRWISAFAGGIGAGQAVVIVEPDGLAQLDCLPPEAQSERLELIRHAVAEFKARAPNARVYLDIGHSAWLSAAVAARRLTLAGIAGARGFALNVSNFRTTADSAAYGQSIVALLAAEGLQKSFVVDTSRNGNGPLESQWCDPRGRRLGEVSSTRADDRMEMTLWIKNPGTADGCAAPAGTFVPSMAQALIHGSRP